MSCGNYAMRQEREGRKKNPQGFEMLNDIGLRSCAHFFGSDNPPLFTRKGPWPFFGGRQEKEFPPDGDYDSHRQNSPSPFSHMSQFFLYPEAFLFLRKNEVCTVIFLLRPSQAPRSMGLCPGGVRALLVGLLLPLAGVDAKNRPVARLSLKGTPPSRGAGEPMTGCFPKPSSKSWKGTPRKRLFARGGGRHRTKDRCSPPADTCAF